MNQTERIRKYCNENKGKLFDLNYLSKTIFNDIPLSNLRKYITRLVEEHILTQVSKGLFIIEESNKDRESIIIDHYLFGSDNIVRGIPSGKFLLYKEGIIEDEPEIKTIKSNYTYLNKNIENIQIKFVNTDFDIKTTKLMTILELIKGERALKGTQKSLWIETIYKYLIDYNDSYFDHHIICYPRIVYLRLANLLKIMHISNRVMEIYENQYTIQHYKK